MAELRTLGALELLGSDGRPIEALLTRQRRAALLVYLALEAPGGFVRREPLLAMFWPEMDEGRGRAALRQALYVLRSEAGEDLITTRGADEVGVDPSLSCDAAAFEGLLRDGKRSEALALYKGPFLNGFFIPDAPEFEHWVDARRDVLRRQALACAKAVADERLERGDSDGGIRTLREALAIEPSDEQVALALLRALDAAGDRAAVLREYDAFALTLARDYDLEPSAEVRAVADAIRGAPKHGSPPGTWTQAEAESSPALPGPVGARHRHTARRWPYGVAAAAVIVLGAGYVVLKGRAIADAAEPRLVVLPFAVHGSEQADYLGEGMTDMLSTSLDGPELFRSVSPTVVLGDLRARGTALTDAPGLRSTARRFGARHFVMGSVVSVQGQLRFDARLYGDAGDPLVQATVTGHPDSIFHLVDRLATQLIAGSLGNAPARRLRASAALTTQSLPALRDYLQGERALREGAWSTAENFFRKAVAEDSTFALAYYRLGVTVVWLGDPMAARDISTLAQRHSSRLSVKDRALLSAQWKELNGHDDQAELELRAILQGSPDDTEAWLNLGEVLFHSNPLRGRSIREASEPFYRVLSYDPSHRVALLHLARIAASVGNRVELDSLASRYEALAADGATLGIRAMAASLRHDNAAMDAVIRAAATATDDAVIDAGRVTFAYASNPEASLAIFSANLRPGRSAERRALTQLQMGAIDAARGRARDARARFAAAEAVFPSVARHLEIFYALRGAVPPAREELLRMRNRLESSEIEGITGTRRLLQPASLVAVHSQIRLALLSEVSERLGDTASADRYQAELDGSRAPAAAKWARDLVVEEWRTFRDVAAGRAARALRGIAHHPLRDPEAATLGFPWTASLRAAKALALEQLGRSREAVALHSSFEQQSIFFTPFAGGGLLRAAALQERLGDRAGAKTSYERVLVLWSDADPEYRTLVDSAKARLAALR